MSQDKPVFVLIDGHSLAFRAYYAFLYSRHGALCTSTGIPTSICFGFVNSLLQVIESEQPQYLAIAFDLPEPTFRHQADTNYKANRSETPEDFIPDLANLQELLTALNLSIVTAVGYEADDVIGTLAQQGANNGYAVKILTGDRDMFQLVDDERAISILYTDNKTIKAGKGYAQIDRQAVIDRLQITPEQVIDYKALCGDKSDNIPGVKGIGDKTAVKLLSQYQTLENVYQNLAEIKGAVNKKLTTDRDSALHSQHLATIVLDVPLKVALSECELTKAAAEPAQAILQKLEFTKLSDRINEVFSIATSTPNTAIGAKTSNETTTNNSGIKPKITAQQKIALFLQQAQTEGTANTTISQDNKPPQQDLEILLVDDEAKLNQLIAILEQQTDPHNPTAWDTETTSLEPHLAELVGIGCCWGTAPGQIAYIPTKHQQGQQLELELVRAKLRPILESDRYPKILQNAKFDRLILRHQGIQLRGVVFDSMLASYVLNPDSSHNLTDLSFRYGLECHALSYKDLGLAKGETIASLDIATVAQYCGKDCYATYGLYSPMQADLERHSQLNKLLQDVEVPLEVVLAEMESVGIALNVPYLENFSEKLATDLDAIEQSVYKAAGEEFNLSSPKQLSVILFDKLELDRKKSRRTKTGYSTNQAVLEKLKDDHPIIEQILEYRTLAKLKSTYVDALPALIRKDTSRVHTDFNQAVTATGRLSSSNPNLQNIPIRTEFSRQIRKGFIPKSGWLLVAADYSQIELRILAHLSQEAVLVDAYRKSLDVHRVTAQLLFEKEEITSEERRLGKIINFGVIYGMGAGRFSRESGLSTKVGKEFIDKYRQRYAKVFEYLDLVKKQAIAQGYVETILGRRRYFNFASKDLQKRQGAAVGNIDLAALDFGYQDAQLLRAAANSTIQGSSADIIKIAMVDLYKLLQKYQANMLIQVHDELVFELPPEEYIELAPQIIQAMENAVTLSVPLVVEMNSGDNWMEAK